MPTQKRSEENHETDNEDDLPQTDAENHGDDEDDEEDEEDEEDDEEEDEELKGSQQEEESEDGSTSSSDESSYSNEKEEFILVRLSDLRKEVQCPICLGIIRKTRTVMECLHRFCRECIDKSMRMGNNECPACRKHCASRRSLRDDPNFDSLIAALYPDIDQYEDEELAFQEEEKARNKQIQTAIAETLRRQSEALTRKRRRSNGNYRRRRNCRSEDDDGANGHDGGKDSSSADDRCTEFRPKRQKRWKGQPSPAATSGDRGGEENEQEVHRDAGIGTAMLVVNSEKLVWGRGGIRSNTRYGSGSGGNSKHARSRLAKLGEHLRNSDEIDNERDIHVALVSLDEQKAPVLQHSYLCGRPTLSVGQLRQYIALQTSLSPAEVEILGAKSLSCTSDTLKDDLKVLDSEETLTGLKASSNFRQGRLVLAYRQKVST